MFVFQEYLDKMATLTSDRLARGQCTAEDLVQEEVFKQTYIPQRLDEVRELPNNYCTMNDECILPPRSHSTSEILTR